MFWTYLGPVIPLFFSFGIRTSLLCLSHYCILEAYNLFGVTGSQLENNWPQDESHLEDRPSLIEMLFRLDSGILDFRVDTS